MDEQRGRLLIVDTDSDTLMTLQHLLEDAGFDATITWDQAEAQQLVGGKSFDLIVVGDHPPELDAATILRFASPPASSHPSLILRGIVPEEDLETFRGLGAIDVVPKRDPTVIVEQIRKVLSSRGSGPRRQH